MAKLVLNHSEFTIEVAWNRSFVRITDTSDDSQREFSGEDAVDVCDELDGLYDDGGDVEAFCDSLLRAA